MQMRVGYVPLTDAAVIIAAAERGFASAEGIEIELVREMSWATIRDRLVFGHFAAAHMLAPLAIAITLGHGHVAMPLAAPVALNLGGNAVTVSRALADTLGPSAAAGGLTAVAVALRVAVQGRTGERPITFGTVFGVSTHTYLLRRLFATAGLEPDRDVRIVVIPPPLMVDALRRGFVDGFCVGSPWNSVAVDEGVGTILLLGNEIEPHAPEKVLAVPAKDADAPHVAALVRATRRAADWCAATENHGDLAALLADPRHLDLPEAIIRRTLDGRIVLDATGRQRVDPEFLLLGGAGTNRPDPRHAAWLFAQMQTAGHAHAGDREAALAVYRPDVEDLAFGVSA